LRNGEQKSFEDLQQALKQALQQCHCHFAAVVLAVENPKLWVTWA
jgi:hypothetical protein